MTIPSNIKADDIFLRIADVEHQTSLKKSTLYVLAKKGDFPAPVRLGKRASRWLQSEILEWMRDRIAATRGQSL
jgi:prophage regulatory protein